MYECSYGLLYYTGINWGSECSIFPKGLAATVAAAAAAASTAAAAVAAAASTAAAATTVAAAAVCALQWRRGRRGRREPKV